MAEQPRATLEALPTELHMEILRQIPDRPSLISAVCSSSVLYRAFMPIRLELLTSMVKRECDTLCLDFKDAVTVVRSRGLCWTEHKDEAIALLDTWRRSEEIKKLNRDPYLRTDRAKDLNEISELFTLLKKLRFFLEAFDANSPVPDWIAERRRGGDPPLRKNLRDIERRRFLRALCRLQIHANVLGEPPNTPDNNFRVEEARFGVVVNNEPFLHNDGEACKAFFGILPPWEIEEMCSALVYLGGLVKGATPEICAHLIQSANSIDVTHGNEALRDQFRWWPSEVQPPWSSRYPTVTMALESIPEDIATLANFGPEMVYQILFADTITLKQNLVMTNSNIMLHALGDWNLRYRDKGWLWPLLYPADRYMGRNVKLKDLWDTSPYCELQRPNIAWHSCYISNREQQAEYLEDAMDLRGAGHSQDMLGWCYAIWDDTRLAEWGPPR